MMALAFHEPAKIDDMINADAQAAGLVATANKLGLEMEPWEEFERE